VTVSFRFVGERFGDGHKEIELFFRRQSESGDVVVLDKGEGQRSERLGFSNAEGQEIVVLCSRFFRRHGLAPDIRRQCNSNDSQEEEQGESEEPSCRGSHTVAVGLYEAWRLQIVLCKAATESLLFGKMIGIV